MPTRKAWDNPDYEGKALRKIFTRLQKRFMNEDEKEDPDGDKLIRLAHTLTLIARSKQELAKYAYQDKRLQALEDYIESKKLKKFVNVEGDLPAIN